MQVNPTNGNRVSGALSNDGIATTGRITPEMILEDIRKLKNNGQLIQDYGMFLAKSANEWMQMASKRPVPKMLFSELWHEGELCILFADTNLGKSILAVQIADTISKGMPTGDFKLEAGKQPVLYFDFELQDKQFEHRYSRGYTQHYSFDEHFTRVEIDPDMQLPDDITLEEYLIYSIEQSIKNTHAAVLIIDNITYLREETEQAKDALLLMKQLKALKNKYGLSILALAHTPKRDLAKPITRNDLQGSKMLINFCDSSFAIGESSADSSVRYIKQIKARNTEMIYDSDNVCLCQIQKDHNFLKFVPIGYGKESEQLCQTLDKEQLENEVKSALLSDPDLPAYGIAKKIYKEGQNFGSLRVRVHRIMKKLKANGA